VKSVVGRHTAKILHAARASTVAVVILLASCAGPATRTVATSQDVAADKALAAAANLRLTDFPTGWKSIPPRKGTVNQQALLGRVQTCFHASISALDLHGPTRVTSPVFAQSGQSTGISTVVYRATKGQVQAALRIYRNSRYIRCVTSVIGGYLKNAITHAPTTPQGVTAGDISVNTIALPPFGDQSLAIRVLIPILYKGQPAGSEYFDDITIQKGRALATLEFTGSSDSPTNSNLEQHLVGVVIGRLVRTSSGTQ
jgi:hypothetical protein